MSKFKVGDVVNMKGAGNLDDQATVVEIDYPGKWPIRVQYHDDKEFGIGYEYEFQLVKAAKVRALKGDNKVIFEALVDGREYRVGTLANRVEWARGAKVTDATVTARIRDLRKPIYGGHNIVRRQEGKLHFYRLVAA